MSAPFSSTSANTAPTVLVTGGAKRLGREIALALAAGGWRVAVHYKGSALEAEKTVSDCAVLTPGAALFQADLSD
jgi:NAD(P)-dependent dehydrogenase (short-subunit alcohol dehydrogenase family)